ncbi:MAG: four helix bundle protein [Patescibacteria group bacterium]|jgi:four helix bundle protein
MLITQNSKLKSQNHNAKVKTELRFRCYCFSLTVIKFLGTLPEKMIYWKIGDQLMRSATSVGANIIEAKSASSKRDFIKYYEIALKSANETKYWLGLLRDGCKLDRAAINRLLDETNQLSRIIGASLLTLKNKR